MKISSIFSTLKHKKVTQPQKKIISFDGGGVRAIAGIVFLKKFEEETGKKVSMILSKYSCDQYFFTSLALKPSQAKHAAFRAPALVPTNISKVSKTFFWDQASLIQARPRYETKGRVEILKELFKNKNLSDSHKPI